MDKNFKLTYKEKVEEAKRRYMKGERNPEVFQAIMGVSQATVYRRMKQWESEYCETYELQNKIKHNVQIALNTALEKYANDPDSSELHGLTQLLNKHMELVKPTQKIYQHMIEFCDHLVTFSIETKNEILRKAFQEAGTDFTAFLRNKYNA